MKLNDLKNLRSVDGLLEYPDLKKSSILEEILVFAGTKMRLPPKNKNSGKYISSKLWEVNIVDKNIDFWKGLQLIISIHPRGTLISGQIHRPSYGALTPIILAGFKMYRDIDYSSWEVDGLESIVDLPLYKMMTYKPKTTHSGELLALRNKGLVFLSGKKAGQVKDVKRAYKLNNTDSWIDSAPALAQIVLCQLWLANPDIRNRYMVLDCENWDNIPDPLISSDVFI